MAQLLSHASDADQLTLRFKAKREVTFESYFVPPDNQTLDRIMQLLDPEGKKLSTFRILYLWGETGVGKTHLLQAACYEQFLRKRRTVYIPLSDVCTQHPEVFKHASALDGLQAGHWSVIALDQCDALLTCSEIEQKKWFEKLTYFLQSVRDQNLILIWSSQVDFRAWPLGFQRLFESLALPESHFMIEALAVLSLPEKTQALQHLATLVGMPLSESVASFLLDTCHQNLSKSLDALEHVMRVAYLQKKSVTLSFVKQLFQFN